MKNMANKGLENKTGVELLVISAGEQAYLSSMMPEVRQEGYTCVSGCQDCVSCGGNDVYALKKK